MFLKKEKIYSKEICVDSNMLVIPNNIEQHNREVMEKLLQLVLLLKERYHLVYDIKGKFNALTPDQVSIVLFNSRYGKHEPLEDAENMNPIAYLKSFGGTVKKEGYINYTNCSNSVVTLNKSRLGEIANNINLLLADVDQNNHTRGISRY